MFDNLTYFASSFRTLLVGKSIFGIEIENFREHSRNKSFSFCKERLVFYIKKNICFLYSDTRDFYFKTFHIKSCNIYPPFGNSTSLPLSSDKSILFLKSLKNVLIKNDIQTQCVAKRIRVRRDDLPL